MDCVAEQIDLLEIEIKKSLEIKRTFEGQGILIRDKKTGRFVKVSK